ncbi:SAM-dependent methyltransferase [Actinoplanes friuliensis DSM 7358]|uniref:SAM-dependent methyltransferase n=2 Tax=Actinoplanes friuliensis TaxID=196914 RepID=U5W3A6_9ACTN|nr:SAM-dependent methyltransferase [Actinoplanes friuliensis DSM 7358]
MVLMLSPEILEYYQRGGEQERLTAGAGRLEFLRTWDVLTRTLPPAPARILDVGGATGIYARPLAEAGHSVRVIDPVPEHVTTSGALDGVTAAVGDARDLPEADGSADAVLLLGPLYHLGDRADRLTAWREAARVVRPGGVVVAAVISRYASMLDGILKGFFADPAYVSMVDRTLTDGVHSHRGQVPRWFTSAYFHHPDEPAAEAAEAGLTAARTVAVEGPAWLTGPRLLEFLDDDHLRGVMLDHLRRVEAEPSLLGASSHLLTVAHRPAV